MDGELPLAADNHRGGDLRGLWRPPGRPCPGWHAERDAFLTSVLTTSSEIIIVSNEVGTSLVPENAAARLFRDEQGRLNQLVAAACDAVFLVTAGLPLRLK